ncbi:30S ribosomal protein S16 [Candidatus Mycoplasma haematohominis]|uniref:30S ribosomal protein S16 n=1 Tax=Candidatus Mycoplasma haematohominis TaxID=1494318 RepID=UPI001C0A7559|nr:30S ribosomal protein S16 [Candidatus Mycoplasma haemohominis]
MLKIRLSRGGRKALPIYRIVLIDSRKKRDGAYLDLLGTYNPFSKDIKLDLEKYSKYLSTGAQPTNIVKSLHKKITEANN